MDIFRLLAGTKKITPQVELTESAEKKKYDILAALSKALLVFMLSYGAVGGFLSAYGIRFNHTTSVAVILGLSILLCLIYETGRKWFTNLCVIGIFLVYAYMAVSRFWILNSGAYAVINEMYEAAQNYLGIVGGGLYQLQVEDSYRTVTAIAIFVGVVLDILLVLRLQYKASLPRVILLTFTAYLVPIYFELLPDQIYLFMLLAGYVTIGILQFGGVKTHISGQIRSVLPIGVAVAAALLLFMSLVLPQGNYRGLVPKNSRKEASELSAVNYAQYGVMALLMNNTAGGGINAGRLSQNITVMPDNETDLIVRFTPYSVEPLYLKAFTGLSYNGQQWSDATRDLGPTEGSLTTEGRGRKTLYEEDSQLQSKGIMEVINVDADQNFDYRPYYTETDAIKRIGFLPENGGRGTQYTYYPAVTGEEVPGTGESRVSNAYLEVPILCRNAVEKACTEAGFSGTPEQIAEQIIQYFSTNFAYTLRPGYYFGGMDYISYFLDRNKKGFCTHFASAGTMLFRYMGIPARYVEGYMVSYTEVVTEGDILVDEPYEEYYDGYAPLGKTALVEVEIPDASAHAWVEIYLPEKGWTLVDVTPAAGLEEETTGSFWDAILNDGSQDGTNGEQAQEVADYLETALSGGLWVFGVLAFALAALYGGRWFLAQRREAKLSGRERVQLEYGRLTKLLKEREETFAILTTPQEELDWIRDYGGAEVSGELKEELYRIFFAPEEDRDYEGIRRKLLEIRKSVKKNRFR